MKNYLRIYDNVLSENDCKSLIDMFNEQSISKRTELIYDETKHFEQLLVNTNIAQLIFKNVLNPLVEQYKKDCSLVDYQFPKKYGYEQPRIKKYYNSECNFKPHVDAIDSISSKRFLSFLFYLNDVEETGETIFFKSELFNQDLKIKPKMGRVVMFPPLWLYPHEALPLKKNKTKYIMSTYLNYI